MRLSRLFPALAILITLVPPADVAAQDIPEMSPEAAAAFAEGMAKYTDGEYSAAAEAFARAYQQDPSFAVAAFYEGLNWGNAGEGDRADSAYTRAVQGRDRMSAYYQHRLSAQLAIRAGDRQTYLEENRKAARLAPGSKAVYNVAQGAGAVRRPREALDALSTLDPDRPPMKGWIGYWTVLHSAQHQVGEYESELTSAREARKRFPQTQALLYDEAEALLALGRTDELDPVVRAFEQLEARLDAFLVTLAAEADAHGHPAVARSLLDRAMEHFAALSPDEAGSNTTRSWKAIAHYTREELSEAEAIFRALAEGDPDNDAWSSWLGVIAGERGDRSAAEAEIRRLLEKETPEDRGLLSLYAASIAAALGDGDRFGELMERALEAGRPFNAWDHRHPVYRKIREHPAYEAFVRPAG